MEIGGGTVKADALALVFREIEARALPDAQPCVPKEAENGRSRSR
jgi:hypothetical protein